MLYECGFSKLNGVILCTLYTSADSALAINFCKMLIFFLKCLLSIWGIRDFDPMTWKNSCCSTSQNCCYVLKWAQQRDCTDKSVWKMLQFRNVVFCLLKYKRKMMNELEYDKKREIVSLVVFQCVKFRVCSSLPGSTVEFLHDVRQGLSDVCAKAHHMA